MSGLTLASGTLALVIGAALLLLQHRRHRREERKEREELRQRLHAIRGVGAENGHLS